MPYIHAINVSDGGVPKRPVERAGVGGSGLSGDRQRDTRHHGGPMRAVCLFSLEVIETLRAEGHPIGPGDAGENLTIAGLDWAEIAPGCRLSFDGGVELEVTSYTEPCATIRDAFRELDFRRIRQELHPGQSRVYARVLREGTLRTGEGVRLLPAGG